MALVHLECAPAYDFGALAWNLHLHMALVHLECAPAYDFGALAWNLHLHMALVQLEYAPAYDFGALEMCTWIRRAPAHDFHDTNAIIFVRITIKEQLKDIEDAS